MEQTQSVEQRDPFWNSPTVRQATRGLIAGLLGLILWLGQRFVQQFDTRMSSMESDVRATKVVVITLAVKGGVDVSSLMKTNVANHDQVPHDHSPELPEQPVQLLYIPTPMKTTLKELTAR